jgi:hypothetical protein
MQADQELGLAGRQHPDGVRFPDLVEQRACHATSSSHRRDAVSAYRASARPCSPVKHFCAEW